MDYLLARLGIDGWAARALSCLQPVEIFRLDGLIVQDVSGTNSIYSNEIRCFGTRGDWDDLGAKV